MKHQLEWHAATVCAHRDLSPTVREFEIRPGGGVKPWTVGSHLDVRVDAGGREETRSYSLVGLPRDTLASQVYRIAVKRAQPSRGGSRYLWSLNAGDEILIGEPNNHFELAGPASEYLIVAGGIGITPLLGMVQTLAATGATLRMCYAVRSRAEAVYGETLHQALGDRLRLFCSDAGQRIDLDAEIAALAPGAQMRVCGPITLLDDAHDAWQRSGRDPSALRFETFGNTGRHETQAFWVELPRHGLRIEVPAERSLLDVLNEAGVDTLYDCRRGECGLCAIDVLSVQGSIDHRDVFFSSAEKAANRQLCACVSRVNGGGVVLDSAYRPD